MLIFGLFKEKSVGRHHIMCVLFCLTLLTQVVLAPLVAQSQMSNLRSLTSNNDEVMMICSGTEIKWISKLVYLQTGKVEFVAEPQDVPTETSNFECPNSLLVKFSAEMSIFETTAKIKWQQFIAVFEALLQRPYTSFAYQVRQPRAPPVL